MSNSVINVKPQNNSVNNISPKNKSVINVSPNNKGLLDSPFTYIENRTILKGQPIPWGLNWLITYSSQLNFQGARI